MQSVDVVTSPQKTESLQTEQPTEHEPVGSIVFSLYFIDQNQKLVAVNRRGPKHEKEKFVLTSLYLGPTDAEKKRGIAFLTCGTTGANLLSINAGLATIQLTGNCNGCGAVGVYDSIVKTLKQFPSVSYVHVLDVDGKSQRNGNLSDARPECLEP